MLNLRDKVHFGLLVAGGVGWLLLLVASSSALKLYGKVKAAESDCGARIERFRGDVAETVRREADAEHAAELAELRAELERRRTAIVELERDRAAALDQAADLNERIDAMLAEPPPEPGESIVANTQNCLRVGIDRDTWRLLD